MSANTTNNLLTPPSPTTIMPPQILQTSGSATGNPRNKCALKPGHSLMDWIRLGNSGVDLSGTKGRIIPVTPEELAKHNRREDAWMAIRGVVYNVTRYMDFHPGGVEELMRGVGKDATKLFNEVHAWVNYQQLLNKCIIGPLKASTKLEKALEESTKIIATTKKSVQFSKPPLPPQDVTPRLDWIQNRNSITLYFYTKQFCNPGSLIRNLNQEKEISHIEIWILIDINLHKYKFEFHGQVKWPPKDVKISTESGKIEIVFEKPEENKNLWQELGKYEVKKILRNSVEDELLIEFIINRKTQYNHDSFTMEMKNEHVIYNMPLGYHVSIEGLINSAKLSKCYTPIPIKYLRDCEDNECKEQNLYFIIKKYNHPNSFSSYLNSVANKSVLNISIPKGNFKLSSLAGHRTLCFLAAGSGLTPFLSLIEHLLKRNTNRIELLKFIYFNKTSEDIWCQEVLSNMVKQDERFEFTTILSNPDDNWIGYQGHVSVELLAPHVGKSNTTNVSYIGVCGPPGFNRKVEEILQELEFPKANLFIF